MLHKVDKGKDIRVYLSDGCGFSYDELRFYSCPKNFEIGNSSVIKTLKTSIIVVMRQGTEDNYIFLSLSFLAENI